MEIERLIDRLKVEWAHPHRWSRSDLTRPDLEGVCRFSLEGATPQRIQSSVGEVPDALREFWTVVEWAELFRDEEYGQWGLRIFTPEKARQVTSEQFEIRPDNYKRGDLVIGEFLGDSDLLVIRGNQRKKDFGTVLIALPIDKRAEWYIVSDSFEKFLHEYVNHAGQKFWE